MSYADQYKLVRGVLVAHVSAAWSPDRIHYGTVEVLATETNLPATSILKENGGTIEHNSPPVDMATETVNITGVWARPSEGTNLEDYCLDRAEELRNRIADDNHLISGAVGTVTDVSVVSIGYDIPSGTDPTNKRVYVYLQLAIQMPFYR